MMDFDNHIVKIVVFEVGHGCDECILLGRLRGSIQGAQAVACEFSSPVSKSIARSIDELFESIHGLDRTTYDYRRAKCGVFR